MEILTAQILNFLPSCQQHLAHCNHLAGTFQQEICWLLVNKTGAEKYLGSSIFEDRPQNINYYVCQISTKQFVCLGCLKEIMKYCAAVVSHSQLNFG